MTKKIILKLFNKIASLEKEVQTLKRKKTKKKKITTYQFSTIKCKTLNKLFTIEKEIPYNEFNHWFNYQHEFQKNTLNLFKELIFENKDFIEDYNEDDLKMNFISPFLNKVRFKNVDKKIRGFYHGNLTYETKQFILNGYCDFYVAKGLLRAKKTYFFIQEFKQDEYSSHPEPQLIAELISAVELNHFKSIQGAYIIGNVWRFVILNRLKKHNYQYFVSHNFDSMKLTELKAIYKNLLYIKNEIINQVTLVSEP